MTDIVERLRVAAPLPTGLYCEAADVIDALRQQLFEEHEAHLIAEQRWIEQMAESQAREKVRVDAINFLLVASIPMSRQQEEVWPMLRKASDIPTDDTALKAALAAERERCIKALRLLWGESCLIHDREIAAIRALGEEI